MCRTLSVNEKGYYKWLRNGDKPKKWQDLLVEIHRILDEDPDNDNYGADRMLIALTQKGIQTSLSSVRRALRNGNLMKPSHRSPDGLTKADKKAMRPQNLLKQDFTSKKPNEKWLTDITQIPCKDGKLYIAPIFDCFGGEIISLAMDTNMKKELCIKALGKHHAVQSMSDVGKCYDNARMESFFATLKKEKLYRMNTTKMTVEQVKSVVFRYVMIYYNRKRISTVNPGGLPPSIFREQSTVTKAVA